MSQYSFEMWSYFFEPIRVQGKVEPTIAKQQRNMHAVRSAAFLSGLSTTLLLTVLYVCVRHFEPDALCAPLWVMVLVVLISVLSAAFASSYVAQQVRQDYAHVALEVGDTINDIFTKPVN